MSYITMPDGTIEMITTCTQDACKILREQQKDLKG